MKRNIIPLLLSFAMIFSPMGTSSIVYADDLQVNTVSEVDLGNDITETIYDGLEEATEIEKEDGVEGLVFTIDDSIGDFVNGNFDVSGWAAYPGGLGNIIISVEDGSGALFSQMASRSQRNDDLSAMPSYTDFQSSGYMSSFDISSVPDGKYILKIEIWNLENTSVIKTYTQEILKGAAKNDLLTILDEPSGLYTNNSLIVSGWALYSQFGISNDIQKVEIQASAGDKKVTQTAVLSKRVDVEANVPGYADYEKSGFNANVDLSSLPDGQVDVLVRIYATGGALIWTHSKTLTKMQGGIPRSYAFLDTPKYGQNITDTLTVSGWALETTAGNSSDVTKVEITFNGETVNAILDVREDLKTAIPGFGDYKNSGFSYTFDTSSLPNNDYPINIDIYSGNAVPVSNIVTSVSKHGVTKLAPVTDFELDYATGLATWAGSINDVNVINYSLQLYKDGNSLGDPVIIQQGSPYKHDFFPAITVSGVGSYSYKIKAIGDGVPFESSDESAFSSNLVVVTGTNFADDTTWGIVPTNTTLTVETEDTSKYLKIVGGGSGNRSAAKTFENPISSAKQAFSFDVNFATLTDTGCSGAIEFRDKSGNYVFRLQKAGGANGALYYSIGASGNLNTAQSIRISNTDLAVNGKWLKATVIFDYENENVVINLSDKNDPSISFTDSVSLAAVNFSYNINSIVFIGYRASGTLTLDMRIANLFAMSNGILAPEKPKFDIESILTNVESKKFEKGTPLNNVVSTLPTTVDVKLTNGVTRPGIKITWSSDNYNGDELGSYQFKGVIDLTGLEGVSNGNNIGIFLNAEVVSKLVPPVIPGYTNLHYTDFGDAYELLPAIWGFGGNAERSIKKTDIAGNATSKLEIAIRNVAGSRNAEKVFSPPITGGQVLFDFDWYVGKVNDKGTNLYENGADCKLMDTAGNNIFRINYTNGSKIAYYAGSDSEDAKIYTEFTNPEKWYHVTMIMDITTDEIELTLTDIESGVQVHDIISLAGISYDRTIARINFNGLRTSGNNITWVSYVDNMGIYNTWIDPKTIIGVSAFPYKTVYVGEVKSVNEFSFPTEAKVTVASGASYTVQVKDWKETDKKWNPDVSGVYSFTGEIVDVDETLNNLNRVVTFYVYNRLNKVNKTRTAEWLDRGVIALKAETGVFVSWRLLASEYTSDISFNVLRNGKKINETPLKVTNFLDTNGNSGDQYVIETVLGSETTTDSTKALDKDYLSIPMQRPEGGILNEKPFTYSVNDCGVGDLDGDGEYEVIVKWYPSNAIDSASSEPNSPTIFDAYKLDGTLLWRMNMGNNLTSGAHYNQFLVYDFDGDGKSEFFIKTADGTAVYGIKDGKPDYTNIISQIGNPADNGKYMSPGGHVTGGPEYISIFNGLTGKVIDTVEYDYSIEKTGVESWGDNFYNRSDRFLAAVAYLDGTTPSAVFCRGYYARTTLIEYKLVNGKLVKGNYFDSEEAKRSDVEGKGNHGISVADLDNDGKDEIVYGSVTFDDDLSVLYVMDGNDNRVKGSHGDAQHVGAFDPERQGYQIMGVHEDPTVASVEVHDGATGETIAVYYANKDCGRGLAANITTNRGFEYWGAGGAVGAVDGRAIYNITPSGEYQKSTVIAPNNSTVGISMNFATYWDGDLLHELLDSGDGEPMKLTEYNEATQKIDDVKLLENTISCNGTKATPPLQADIFGDWREEILIAAKDQSELRIYSTTIPTDYRLYTLMHDPLYRLGIAWQNVGYNQPPHLSFYMGEDEKSKNSVVTGALPVPNIKYTNGK